MMKTIISTLVMMISAAVPGRRLIVTVSGETIFREFEL